VKHEKLGEVLVNNEMRSEVIYKTGDEALIDDVHELWNELNQVHLEKSLYCRQFFEAFTFHDRKKSLLSDANRGKLFIIIACCDDVKVGYCISSVVDGVGDISSIYVKPDYRGSQIGNTLMEKSLGWIQSNAAKEIIVKVAVGNEDVLGFYEKYDFKPRLVELQVIPD
jgi:ribosomal protein S18 acetylase RimI-like enzyme